MRIPGSNFALRVLRTARAVSDHGAEGTRRLAQITSPEEHLVHTDWKGKEYEGQSKTPLHLVMKEAEDQLR